MPNARTHDIITAISGAALAPVAYYAQTAYGVSESLALRESALLVTAHLVSGLFFSPDLDIDSAIDNRWGPFFWIWRPYMWFVPHRHFWSHGLILPPLLRLLYFYLVVVGLMIGASWLLSQVDVVLPTDHRQLTMFLVNLARDYPMATGAVMIGFVTGGAAHTIADWWVTTGRRLFGKPPRRHR